ncbi:hypothetical protein CON17_19855 [Bacillus thuringiensis]|uniref:hypothetical protein n=1 Tax=Bacillus cereus group TaxID=86661 RepID=UPI000BEB4A51|nr:hypothetical protein [Bacillus thuringiensis]MCU5508178.1 hypothetical protein [Bacillus cereus]MDA2418346.1 hypothetical protein [Bacillus cereus]MDR4924592.1 hypothetical protein [Bacillus thuringiensis]MED3584438.1 hypothetical protein [Bacillus thuringiensis]PEC95158.1 hypothetical protein CON17_19855 [Bacillus thuringiensis]
MPRIDFNDKEISDDNLQTIGIAKSSPPWSTSSSYNPSSLNDGNKSNSDASFWFERGTTSAWMGIVFDFPVLITKIKPYGLPDEGLGKEDFITYVEYRDIETNQWKRVENNNEDKVRMIYGPIDCWIFCNGIRYYFKDNGGISIGSGSGQVRFTELGITGFKINNIDSKFADVSNDPVGLYNDVKIPNIQMFLIQSENIIKKINSTWEDVGTEPVTYEMFKDHGMFSLNSITEEQWKALPSNSKILAYTETEKQFTASISQHYLYNSEDKLYRGTGMIETDTEELPTYRKTLVIAADHQECTFQYSLDNGSTWNAFQSGDVIDVSAQSGKLFKIRINLPTDLATLTAIAYAWA